MAHFAEVIDGVVERVIVADTKEWCETNLGGTWVQTSYNTYAGKHKLGGTPLNKNFAGIGYIWDGTGFAAHKPFESWTLDEETMTWNPPIPKPEGPYSYWDEETLNWIQV
jgi:hypothetical protein